MCCYLLDLIVVGGQGDKAMVGAQVGSVGWGIVWWQGVRAGVGEAGVRRFAGTDN